MCAAPHNQPDGGTLAARGRRMARVLAAAVVVVAGGVMLGWVCGLQLLTDLAPQFAYTMPLPLMVLAAIGLERCATRPGSLLGRIAATVIALAGARTLVAEVLGHPLPVMHLLWPADAAAFADSLPPLPAANTALAMLAIGIGLVAIDARPRRGIYPGEAAAATAGVIALVALVGYANGAAMLGTASSAPAMGLPTALCLLALAIGVLAARPERGLAGFLVSPRLGSAAAARLLPLVSAAPIAFGWMTLTVLRWGVINAALAAALSAVATAVVSAAAIVWTARMIDRLETERQRLEAGRARAAAARAAVEADRSRVGRELHDGVVQELAALKLLLEAEERRHRSDALTLARERITAMLQELRIVVDDLRPHDLARTTLPEAIATQARLLTAERPIAITCDLQEDVQLPDWTAREIFRIAQEAIANAVRHGRPTQVTIRLQHADETTSLEIADNGAGFDVRAARGGTGLQSMRERAHALQADLEIDSRPAAGTRVRLLVRRDELIGKQIS